MAAAEETVPTSSSSSVLKRCYDEEQKRDNQERHPVKQEDKHGLKKIEITDVPDETKDKDDAPAFVTTCHKCHLDIEMGHGWRCEICPDFDVCDDCYRKGVDHPHQLTNHPSIADPNTQNKEAILQKMLDLMVHASQCRALHCQHTNCRKVTELFRHGLQCKVRFDGGCYLCKKMWHLLQLHARACKESACPVPRCRDLKQHLKRAQEQFGTRR